MDPNTLTYCYTLTSVLQSICSETKNGTINETNSNCFSEAIRKVFFQEHASLTRVILRERIELLQGVWTPHQCNTDTRLLSGKHRLNDQPGPTPFVGFFHVLKLYFPLWLLPSPWHLCCCYSRMGYVMID
jgi:hypothetical protein